MIDYLSHALGKPISERNTMPTIISVREASDIASELCDAIEAALSDEAEITGKSIDFFLRFGKNRTVLCNVYGANYAWAALQYTYFVRAVPEALGYTTGYSDRGTVIVTTDAGEFICDFKTPEKVEGLA